MAMFQALKDAVGSLVTPIRALLIAMLGAGLAWLWFREGTSGNAIAPVDDRLLAVLLVIAALIIALLIDALGRGLLSKHPRAAVEPLEWWLVAPMSLAAAAAAAAIVVTVELTTPDGTAVATKEVIAAVATAITAFLSSSFVDWAGDDKDSKLSDRIQSQFEAKYQGYFKPESAGELYVFSGSYKGADGWGRASRRIRAAGIAERLIADKA
jgi:hypothetical protein